MKFNRNNQIMLILYFIGVIFLLIQLYELYSIHKEPFIGTKNKNNKNTIINTNIQSIILSPYESVAGKSKYFGSFVSNSDKDNINNSLYLYETTDLTYNKWRRVEYKNMLLERNNNVIITDISFDKLKRMIVIGLYFKNNKPVYNIYRKESSDMNSYWELVGEDVNIRSICHDINDNTKIIGVSSYDGQIYYNNGDYVKWNGPINVDKPMRKVIYMIGDSHMIGIGLFDNYIYKKTGTDWKNTKWDIENINKSQKVRDLIYDDTGCLIASTYEGIKIQQDANIITKFINIRDKKGKEVVKLNDFLTKDIFKSKLGFEIDNENIFDTNNLSSNEETHIVKDAEKIYKFKENVLEFCSKRKFLKNRDNNISNELDEINFKHQTINDLYKQIEDINQQMAK
jgi:hypothetical protein